MNRISLLLLCALFARAEERGREVMSASADLKNGLFVHFTSMIEPPLENSQILMLWGGVAGDRERDRIHRSIKDKTTGDIIGYDIFAEPAGAPDEFRVYIEPLSKQMTDVSPQMGDGRLRALPKYPPPQVLREGQTMALDLLVSPDGRQKLVDYIQVRRSLVPWSSNATPRDFTLDDGPASFKFTGDSRFYVNGQPYQGRVGFTTMRSGATIWFAPPGRGRFILSLTPHEGWEKAGAIRDNVLSFQAGGEQYEYRTNNAILGEGKAWNLYMFHDPLYQPKVANSTAVFGGVDRLENLLPKR